MKLDVRGGEKRKRGESTPRPRSKSSNQAAISSALGQTPRTNTQLTTDNWQSEPGACRKSFASTLRSAHQFLEGKTKWLQYTRRRFRAALCNHPLRPAPIASLSATIIEVISTSAAGNYPVQSSTVGMLSVCGRQAQQRRKFGA
jgi:hypothetical protein